MLSSDSNRYDVKTEYIPFGGMLLVKVETFDSTEITAITRFEQLKPAKEVKCLPAPTVRENTGLIVIPTDDEDAA